MTRTRSFLPGVALTFAIALSPGLTVLTQAQGSAPPQPQAAAAEALPAAQTIIDRHIAAVGGRDAIKALNSINIKGSLAIPANGMSGTIEVFAARPNKTLAKTTLAGIGDISEGFDGTVAWSLSPMTGPMLVTGEELAQKAFDSQFDGALGIASRYESIKTLEKTTFEGRPAYKVELTRKNGGKDIDFYDAETGLKAGSIIERKNPMGTISVTTSLTDYKKFGALLQPTVMKQSMTGVQMITTFTSVEYNTVDPSVFELPAEIKALVK
jgi:hypothetical protein